jgi:hypothetical protein
LYDTQGSRSNFDLEDPMGMSSKLGRPLALVSDDPKQARRALENVLRQFVIANKGKFLDLPPRAFQTPPAQGDLDNGTDEKRLRMKNGMFRNVSITFNNPK